jgi:hypothetical protein
VARKRIGEMLIEAGLLDEPKLRNALGEQRRWGRSLGRTLVDMRYVREEDLVRVLATQFGMQTVDLDARTIPAPVLDLVPAELAMQHQVLPFAQPMKFLDIALVDPVNMSICDELQIRTQLNVRPYLVGPKMMERALTKYYAAGLPLDDEPVRFGASAPPRDLDDRPDTFTAKPSVHRGNFGVAPDARAAAHRPMASVSLDNTATTPHVPQRAPVPPTSPPPVANRDAEIDALQRRISQLEALVARDEGVLRKLLALLIEKRVATREEILDRLK